MEQIGYSLIDASGNEVQAFGETKGQLRSPPEVIVLPNGDQVHCAQVGNQLGDWRFVERWIDDAPPSKWHASIGRTIAFDGAKIVVNVQYETTPSIPANLLSQDLIAQFTPDDAAKIQAAVSGNVQFWLLWQAMTAQKDPMVVTNARFLAGWNALVNVLGTARMAAIGAELGLTLS